jgi:hypothetical protein
MSNRAAKTAAEALVLYREALAAGTIIQHQFHAGRNLACALGVLGPRVADPSDCPARIMPRWLAGIVPWFFDNQPKADALAWGEAFYAQLARLDGMVPFSAVHDWHATVVCPLAIEVATKRGRPTAPHEKLAAMHAAARDGQKFAKEEWSPVYRDAYAKAYAYMESGSAGLAAASDIYGRVNAVADAGAAAGAVSALLNTAGTAEKREAKRAAFKRLADGMVECLSRIQPARGDSQKWDD